MQDQGSSRLSSPGFDEAHLLRGAAVVRAVLADHQWHPWGGEVVAACRDLTDGDWRRAASLAYRAMSEYLPNALDWRGPQGQREARLRMPVAEVQAVACPRCGAGAQEPCVRRGTKVPTVRPHEARQDLAAEAYEVELVWAQELGDGLDEALQRDD